MTTPADTSEPPDASPEVSVIIVNWNLKDYLLEAIQSIYDTVTRHRFEIVVIDNASSDGSADAVRQQFPGVTVIENSQNLGFGVANNRGFEIAQGRNLLLLNNDARLLEGSADRLIDFLDARPEVGACGGQLLNSDGTLQNSFDNFPDLATELLNKSLLRWLFPKKYPSKLQETSEPREVEVIIGAMLLARADLIHELGGFDEAYFFFMEEADLCYRIRQANYRLMQEPAARAIHHQGTSSSRPRPAASRIEYFRGKYRFFKKWTSPGAYALLRVGSFLRIVINLLLNLLGGILTLFLHGKTRRRISVYATLCLWHLCGCPASWGLR